MASLLSNFVNKLAGGVQRIKCKYGHDNRYVKLVELNSKIASAFLPTRTLNVYAATSIIKKSLMKT